jgi:hypothetical protein
MEITAELLQVINDTSWFDGIVTLIVLLGAYTVYKYINKKFK